MKKCSGRCGNVVGVIRILTGLAMVYFGVMKLGGGAAGMEQLGGAAPALLPFLGFLSNVARGWIATIGEIVAGVLLLSGCGILVKYGAILTLLIMIFAWNAVGFNPNLLLVSIGALVALLCGPGCGAMCGKGCPCKKTGGCCTGGSCSTGACKTKEESCGCASGACDMPKEEEQQK